MLNPASPTSASCLDPTPENLFYPPKRGDYIYLETPPYQTGESPKVSLARAADASMLAYARFVQQRMVLADLQGILAAAGYPNSQPIGDCFVDGAHTGRGYFASNDSHALLAFRGTEADNNNDKAADAEIDRTPEAGALVHSGFKRYLDSVWGQVTQCVAGYRANHPKQNICITGHSLGGAMATLAFTRLNDPDSSLITFGCPRVGNPDYGNVIDAAARTRACYRAVDNLDIVTHVPPVFLHFYAHPSIAVFWLDQGHTLRISPPDLPSDIDAIAKLPGGFLTTHWMEGLPNPLSEPLADHSPVRYGQYLGKSM
ncbi:MAG: lipase [Edaphobacter sp.]|nr:lipase [Edaphobacter sp.]